MTEISPKTPSRLLPDTADVSDSASPLESYSVLYAEDIPHYGSVDIEARDDAEVLRLAQFFDTDKVAYSEGCWDGAVCKRIVSIEDAAGRIVAQDIPLDDYRLHHGIEAPHHKASVTVDNRFRVDIRRNAPPPMASAQLVVKVYPITDGQLWDEPYDVFVVDEGRIVELENDARAGYCSGTADALDEPHK
jgi:hypothetical protein